MSSVLYKIVSSSIAVRLKPLLPRLTDKTQTGFIEGRFIGERTWLIYDLMNYMEQIAIDGLLMLIDFKRPLTQSLGNSCVKYSAI